MCVKALVLYGSCAREDNDEHSDVDMLALSTESKYRSVSMKKINLSFYPIPLAITMAESGDLFMLHIVSEGKELYESDGVFSRLKACFRYKESYRSEIQKASDFGWFIAAYPDSFRDASLLNKRIAWCVRTILIARAAELKKPIFSAKELSQFAGGNDTYNLIKLKNSSCRDRELISLFSKFLMDFGLEKPIALQSNDIADYTRYFSSTGNLFASKTASRILNVFPPDGYA